MSQFKVDDVVRIHTGITQYDVTRVAELDGGMAKVWPRNPADPRLNRDVTQPEYLGQWVPFNLLHKVPADKVIDYPDPDA